MATTVYTLEATNKLVADYKGGVPVATLAETLGVPPRSVIAKLSSLGVYVRQEYLNKRGEVPRKKSQYIESIAQLLGVDVELCESLEKTNKHLLGLIEGRLQAAA